MGAKPPKCPAACGLVPLLAFEGREERDCDSFWFGSALVGLRWDLELVCARELTPFSFKRYPTDPHRQQ